MSIGDLRQEYSSRGLREEDLDPDPIKQFRHWFDEAVAREALHVPEGVRIVASTPIGYPAESPPPNTKYRKEKIHRDRYSR